MVDGKPVEQKRRVRVGFIRPGQIERAFIVLLYLALLLLIVISVLGTFYGQRGVDAPLATPSRVIGDIRGAWGAFGVAVGIQLILTVVQYGARSFARSDRRWWLVYLAALGISVYYNVQAYWVPLTALIPAYLAGFLIVAGDVLPEFLAVRRE
jgi:hypothetical protein